MDSTIKDTQPQEDLNTETASGDPPETFEASEASETPEISEAPETSDILDVEPPEEDATGSAPDAQGLMIAELTDRLQRTMADFDNFRKRTQKERIGMHDDGVRYTIEKLLPVLDNFERAMDASSAEDSFAVGMQMILKQFTSTLKDDIGASEIPAINESFNPELHFAVSHIDDKQFGANEIIEVLQKGYKYKEKVIRPSMVRVAN